MRFRSLRSAKGSLLLVAGSLVAGLLLSEIVLRKLNRGPLNFHGFSTFVIDPQFGYEHKPKGQIRLSGAFEGQAEVVNSEGWRGPEISLRKPEGTIRVLGLGDSIIFSGTAPFERTWEQRVVKKWERENHSSRLEFINSGVGGYLAWQALSLYERRAAKYQADWVIVHVEWNDLVFSTLRPWTTETSMADFQKVYPPKHIPLAYQYSSVARFLGEMWAERFGTAELPRSDVTLDPHPAFNDEALKAYSARLKMLKARIEENGGRMALLKSPSVFTQSLIEAPLVNNRAQYLLTHIPISAQKFLDWHEKYRAAQNAFLKEHPEVVAIDVEKAFSQFQGDQERSSLFVDHIHFSETGLQIFAETVYQAMVPYWAGRVL